MVRCRALLGMRPPLRPRLRWSLHVLLAVVGVIPAVWRGHVPGDGVDAYGTDWFYWWIRTCLAHGGDPSHTGLFFAPDGKDIFAHTGNNFVDAVFAAPVAWVFGPILSLSLVYVAIQLVNAATFRPLAEDVLGRGVTADVATFLWQLNPFVLFELGAGRPTQAMLWFLPASVLYFRRVAQAPSRANVLWFGLSMAMVGWTYWFNAYFVGFLLLALLPATLREAPDRRRAVLGWAAAALFCLLLVLPAGIGMAEAVDGGAVPGVGADVPQAIANNVEQELHGLWLMETRGEPLFTQPVWAVGLLLALVFARSRWTVAWLVLVFLGLGAGIRVGETLHPHPVYLLLYRYLPFFDRLWFPYRIAAAAFIPATFLLVEAWRRLGARPWVAIAAILLSLAGQHAVWPFPTHNPRPPGILMELTREPGGVIFTPMRIQHDGLSWQTFFARPTFGGMGESASVFWPPGFKERMRNPFIRALSDATSRPGHMTDHTPAQRAQITRLGFRWVVLRRDLARQLADVAADRTGSVIDPERWVDDAIARTSVVVGHGPVGFEGEVVVWDLAGGSVPVWPGSSPR